MKSVSPTTAAHRPSPSCWHEQSAYEKSYKLYTSYYTALMIHLRSEKDSKVFKQENPGESGCFPVT